VRRTCWLSWHSLPCSLQRFWVVMCSTVCTLRLVCTDNR
ncbi:DMSO reductase anchor subunit family protein, partial [Vibrio parahaemolyticus EKP-026]